MHACSHAVISSGLTLRSVLISKIRPVFVENFYSFINLIILVLLDSSRVAYNDAKNSKLL